MLDKKIVYFLTVAEEGSFSAAARKLIMSQPALSQQISLLEEEFCVTLFDRSGYRPVLTEAGRKFYQGCISIKNQCDQLKMDMTGFLNENIRIGFTGLYENKELLDIMNCFKEKNPRISISFLKNTFEGCVQGLLDNELDVSFGIDSDFKHQDALAYEKLFPFEICVICSHNHPLAQKREVDIQKLKNEDFIILSKKFGSQYYKAFMRAFKADGFSPRVKKEVNLFDELVFSVSIGEGIAIVAKRVVRENEVEVIKLLNSSHHSNYVVAWRKDVVNPMIQKLVAETKHYFGKV